jgi:hypothetical protein
MLELDEVVIEEAIELLASPQAIKKDKPRNRLK